MSLSSIRIPVAGERGAVLVITSVAMFAVVMLAAFVIDLANWYEHKRHLQLQADAAALAGAHSFSFSGCSDSLIRGDAHKYGGSYFDDTLGSVVTEPYNDQIGGTPASKMHLLINSAAYYGDSGAGDYTDTNGAPCAAKYIDVKATETHLPWFFGFGGFVSRINAHARVGIVQEDEANATLPIAVPNPLPTSAAAIFIDEANGDQVVARAPLSPLGPSGSLDMWQTCSVVVPGGPCTPSPVAVTIPSRKTGIVIALSGKKSLSLTGSLAAICDQALTDCYDSNTDPPTNGVSFIRGYSAGGTGRQPEAPVLRQVELVPSSTGVPCPNTTPNTPFSFSNNTSNCTYELVAGIDAYLASGGNMPNAAQIYTANGVQLYPDPDDNCALVSPPCWHANLTLNAASGPNDIRMTWEEQTGTVGSDTCKTTGGNKCKGNFDGGDVIQRAYSAVTATSGHSSGPLKIVQLSGPSCVGETSHSYLAGSQYQFCVTIGIAGTLRNATSPSDPQVSLRIKSLTGQSLDCDPGYQNLKQELAYGCRPSYHVNSGTPDCSTIGTSALWSSPEPWYCVAVNTGRQPNDVAAGLNLRIYGNEKPPNTYPNCTLGIGHLGYNNWANFVDNGGKDGFPDGDPRVLDAYITTYGAFSHVNGTSGSVPIIGFGHFYVTGYTGNGMGFDPPTNCNSDPVPGGDTGLIVGHFIRYLDKVGGTGTAPCDPTSINSCVIVMSK
jgi:Putative Flp pilus-assembly TadE/G-like